MDTKKLWGDDDDKPSTLPADVTSLDGDSKKIISYSLNKDGKIEKVCLLRDGVCLLLDVMVECLPPVAIEFRVSCCFWSELFCSYLIDTSRKLEHFVSMWRI